MVFTWNSGSLFIDVNWVERSKTVPQSKECVFAQQTIISLDTPASQNVAENQIKGNNARSSLSRRAQHRSKLKDDVWGLIYYPLLPLYLHKRLSIFEHSLFKDFFAFWRVCKWEKAAVGERFMDQDKKMLKDKIPDKMRITAHSLSSTHSSQWICICLAILKWMCADLFQQGTN